MVKNRVICIALFWGAMTYATADESKEVLSSQAIELWITAALTSATVVLTVFSIAGAIVIWKVIDYQKSFKKDFKALRKEHDKTSHLVFAISNLAISSLPKITFTQQVPALVLENMGIIDEIFRGTTGASFWTAISRQPTAGRLAYSRAVYRLGTKANSREALVGDSEHESPSVMGLLDCAVSALSKQSRSSDLLFGDILVRRCQALRQAGRPEDLDEAEAVAKDLSLRYRNSLTGYVNLWGPWCVALIYLQRATFANNAQLRAECYCQAVHVLRGPYEIAIKAGASPSAAPLTISRAGNVRGSDTTSLNYYMAKALWSFRFAAPDLFEATKTDFPNIGVRLRRALVASIESLETSRRLIQSDRCIDAIYHFCTAFTIAISLELPETQETIAQDISKTLREFVSIDYLRSHAIYCVEFAEDLAKELLGNNAFGGEIFIYCERSERLDTISRFLEDVAWVREALAPNDSVPLANYYSARKEFPWTH